MDHSQSSVVGSRREHREEASSDKDTKKQELWFVGSYSWNLNLL